MNRRGFLASSMGAAGGLTLLGGKAAAERKLPKVNNGAFADLPIPFSFPTGWFKGKSLDEKLAQMSELGIGQFENLGAPGNPEDRKTADKYGMRNTCITAAGRIAPGYMVKKEDHDKVEDQFRARIKDAKVLGINRVIGLTGNVVEGMSYDEMWANTVTCMKRLAPIAEENDIIVVMEALNVLVNHAGFFLTRTDQTMKLLDEVGSPQFMMCFDVYHQQITEGNIIRNLCKNIERIGHIHIGDNPGRQEPGTGEINYRNVFKAIHDEGYKKGKYDGVVTFECGNSGNTDRALARILDCMDWA